MTNTCTTQGIGPMFDPPGSRFAADRRVVDHGMELQAHVTTCGNPRFGNLQLPLPSAGLIREASVSCDDADQRRTIARGACIGPCPNIPVEETWEMRVVRHRSDEVERPGACERLMSQHDVCAKSTSMKATPAAPLSNPCLMLDGSR